MLWRCWLGDRKGIRPVKTEWWGAGVVICLEQGADLHMAQLMSLPLTVFCFTKIQIGFTFLVPAYLSSPGKRAVKRVCVPLLPKIQWGTRFGAVWAKKKSRLNGSADFAAIRVSLSCGQEVGGTAFSISKSRGGHPPRSPSIWALAVATYIPMLRNQNTFTTLTCCI